MTAGFSFLLHVWPLKTTIHTFDLRRGRTTRLQTSSDRVHSDPYTYPIWSGNWKIQEKLVDVATEKDI